MWCCLRMRKSESKRSMGSKPSNVLVGSAVVAFAEGIANEGAEAQEAGGIVS